MKSYNKERERERIFQCSTISQYNMRMEVIILLFTSYFFYNANEKRFSSQKNNRLIKHCTLSIFHTRKHGKTQTVLNTKSSRNDHQSINDLLNSTKTESSQQEKYIRAQGLQSPSPLTVYTRGNHSRISMHYL